MPPSLEPAAQGHGPSLEPTAQRHTPFTWTYYRRTHPLHLNLLPKNTSPSLHSTTQRHTSFTWTYYLRTWSRSTIWDKWSFRSFTSAFLNKKNKNKKKSKPNILQKLFTKIEQHLNITQLSGYFWHSNIAQKTHSFSLRELCNDGRRGN